MRRRLTLTGSTLRARSAEFKALLADEIHRTLWPRLAEGAWKPAMDQTFPLAEAAAAHARMEAGAHVGKIVLMVGCVEERPDRQSGGEGRRVSVRVDIGGRRI